MFSVYLFQLNYQRGQGEFTSQWLPYSVAALWAYVEQFSEIKNNFEVGECFFKREEPEVILNRLVNPSLCLFSNYIWNENYNLLLAKKIKEKYPDCKIVFGGPQVDEVGFNFLINNPFVDSVVINEGEVSLKQLLLDYLENHNIEKVYQLKSRVDLQGLPSPYTDSEIMNNIIRDNPNVKWATTLETNRGCPFACTFCDWGSLTQSKVKKFDLEKVYAEIDWMAKNNIEYIYIADANFGVFYERDKAIAEYIANTRKSTGYPKALNATYYKNSAPKTIEIAEIVHKVGLNRGLTLSVQSMSEQVLTAIERQNMEMSKLSEMYKECDRRNVRYYTEIIIGLPLETKQSWKEGLCKAVEAGCHILLEVYPLEILKNSALAKQIEKHNLEIKHFETIVAQQASNIAEKHNYVISTGYMNREEYIDSWMWVWLMNNFHNYGWTQILSKFAFSNGIDYLTFYEDFYEQCVLKDPLFKKWHDDQKQELIDFFWYGILTETFKDDNIVTYTKQREWHLNREHVVQAISSWAREYFKINQDVLEEVLKFAFRFVTDMERHEPIEDTYKYNVFEFCNLEEQLSRKQTTYSFENRISWDNRTDFYDKLHYRNRNGFALQKIVMC